jgi:energy-coupling factor transport system permease protein
MFENSPMMLGQYRPLDSYLHRLDARAKLVPVIVVMVLSLLTASTFFYIALMVILFAALLGSGVGWRAITSNLRPLLILVIITFLYHIIFSGRGTTPAFTVWGFSVTEIGLQRAAFFSLRLLLFVTIAFLVTLTSSPSDLAESMTKLLRPLEKLRIPVGDLGLVLFIAIRFIPILYDEFSAIRNAQTIRGVRFSGNLVNRLRKSTAIVVPVLLGAINRADELALAMEARGYRSGRPRTFYSRLQLGQTAWLFMVLSTLAISLLFYVTYK